MVFNDKNKNLIMVQGAYRKLKSYYYYNKNFLVMRSKIAEFEWDKINMYKVFDTLSTALCNSSKYKTYFNDLISKVDFYVIPKKFEADASFGKSIISNTISRDKKMKTVNFFIDIPIELHILDTLWTIFLSKMDNDKFLLSYDVYGNTINKTALFKGDDVDYESRTLFNRYFNKYSEWRNNAFDELNNQYRLKKDSLLVSLDIKSYFYSIAFSFDSLDERFERHSLLKGLKGISLIMEKVYKAYRNKIEPYRKDLSWMGEKQYPLPIGLFSSMVLGNIYLKDFDHEIKSLSNVKYYGRYVDDLLFVFDKTISKSDNTSTILDDLFVKTGIFNKNGINYCLNKIQGLNIQGDKIKFLYIDHSESRAIIDIYNETIRIVPSQMDPLPESNIKISDFDEVAYSVENFTKEKKIRDIGFIDIDVFKVGHFFSTLPRKYSQIASKDVDLEINKHIQQIEKFFSGSQGVEFYSNWLNYLYFLVIVEKPKKIHQFMSVTKKQIGELKAISLDKKIYRKITSINKKAKEYLIKHLNICVYVSLCLNFPLAQKSFKRHTGKTKKYLEANIFEHGLVTFPLANYFEYHKDTALCKMVVNDIEIEASQIEENFKFIWSPRFIHYDELLLWVFYLYHKQVKAKYLYELEGLVSKFTKINFLKSVPFKIEKKGFLKQEGYRVNTLKIPTISENIPSKVKVAIGSLNIDLKKCSNACKNERGVLTLSDKEMFFKILRDSYKCLNDSKKERKYITKETMFLVLPELSFPIFWIKDLIRFAKYSKIGIVTGLQYVGDGSGRQFNYIATILPFDVGEVKYNHTFLFIREKNDYSPLEFKEMAKIGCSCKNKDVAEYQIFDWKGIRLAPMVCYEMTDIVARALLKGRCDFVASSVFNPDTTYFSNIIDSMARDLHAFIVQANTSCYGDSRVTGPYDRDSKDVFKIKGGDNDHVVVGTINFKRFKNFQLNYSKKFVEGLNKIRRKSKGKTKDFSKEIEKPDIKPLSARFKIIKN